MHSRFTRLTYKSLTVGELAGYMCKQLLLLISSPKSDHLTCF